MLYFQTSLRRKLSYSKNNPLYTDVVLQDNRQGWKKIQNSEIMETLLTMQKSCINA